MQIELTELVIKSQKWDKQQIIYYEIELDAVIVAKKNFVAIYTCGSTASTKKIKEIESLYNNNPPSS